MLKENPSHTGGLLNERNCMRAQARIESIIDALEPRTWKQALLPHPATGTTTSVYLARLAPLHVRQIALPDAGEPFYSVIHINDLNDPNGPPPYPYHPHMVVPLAPSKDGSVQDEVAALNRHILEAMGNPKNGAYGLYLQQVCGIDLKTTTANILKRSDDASIHLQARGEEIATLKGKMIKDVETALWRFNDYVELQFGMSLIPISQDDLKDASSRTI